MICLFLHIGQPKTATTTIQGFLARNREALMQQGWLYPNSARQHLAHHPLGNFFRDEPLYWVRKADPAYCMRELRKEMDDNDCQNVIMSTETLFFVNNVDKIREYFQDFNVVPIIFLRRQDEWLESAFREQLKNGVIRPDPNNFLKHMRSSLDYCAVLHKWREVFPGRFIVLPFEKTSERKPVEKQFLDAIGFRSIGNLSPAVSQNESFSRDALTFFAAFSERPRIGPKHELFKNVLAEYSRRHRDSPERMYFTSPTMRADLAAEYESGNREIALEYLGRDELFTSPLPDASAPWIEPSELSSSKAIEIAEFLANGIYGRLAKEK